MNKKEENKCSVCIWFRGLWGLGVPSPMGPMDASDGLPTIKCPKCGMSYNDQDAEVRRRSRKAVEDRE